ncbi:MAG: hypothetical protein JXO44_01325 [Clostridia bacterium]|nr:hypothetical protein [Deltaproteobacteria bacterium]MBN2897385.1 hypothetical protein [Clostridia bacterium]
MTNQHPITILDFAKVTIPEHPPYKKGAANTWFSLPQSFPEANLFSLFMKFIGAPNGMMSWALLETGGDPDAPWKWEYVFQIPSGEIFSVQRSWVGVEIYVWDGAVTQKEFVTFLGKNLNRYKQEIAKTLESLEQYTLIINPEVRHRNLAEFAFRELESIKVEPIVFPEKLMCSKTEQKKYTDSLQKYPHSAMKEIFFATTLVSESAFWAESHLNMIIALYRKHDLAKNKKLFNEYLRTPWQKKIEQLPFYCHHIKSPDFEAQPLVESRMLFDLRNRIAHSYPDKESLGVSKMWFLHRIPILPSVEPFPGFQLGLNCILPSRSDAIEVYRRAQNLIVYLNSLIDAKPRESIEVFSLANPIGWNETKGVFSVPFGQVVMSFPQASPDLSPLKNKKKRTKKKKRK